MKIEKSWMQLHLEGVELERSRDKVHWLPVIVEEPIAGDSWYYREKGKTYDDEAYLL